MKRAKTTLALTVVLALSACACACALAGTGGLTRFVVGRGEETGFTPEAPKTVLSVKAWVHEEPAKQAAQDAARLKAEGFVEAVIEHTDETHGHGAGVSTVIELKSSAAAGAEVAGEVSAGIAAQGKGALVHRFAVAGVPGAVGYTAKGPHEAAGAANVSWREGRCTLLVGDFLPKASAARLSGPIAAAARAVYRRTGGSCP
ncbi:MAG TPA: hypothetical protein VKV16_10510 [Solirubrobacteraceae bacterium]|nr:hypothetical protein [Solirubrobacteraceae bacterium]